MCAYIQGVRVEVRDNPKESVLSFHHVGPRDQIRVVSLGGTYLYLLSLCTYATTPI